MVYWGPISSKTQWWVDQVPPTGCSRRMENLTAVTAVDVASNFVTSVILPSVPFGFGLLDVL